MKLVCIGDSLTYGYGVRVKERWTNIVKEKLEIEVTNKGICGDTTTGLLTRFYKDVVFEKATHVVIIGGTNDFLWQAPIEQVKANIAAILFHSIHYNIVPILGIPIPVDADAARENWNFIDSFAIINYLIIEYRQWIKKFSNHYNIKVIDLYSIFHRDIKGIQSQYYIDGLHLNKLGHEKMAEEISTVMQEYLYKNDENTTIVSTISKGEEMVKCID